VARHYNSAGETASATGERPNSGLLVASPNEGEAVSRCNQRRPTPSCCSAEQPMMTDSSRAQEIGARAASTCCGGRRPDVPINIRHRQLRFPQALESMALVYRVCRPAVLSTVPPVLDGQALDRARPQQNINGKWKEDNGNDYLRAARQRDFLILIMERAIDKGARDPNKLRNMAQAVTDGG
jgi:hypothetical protein